MWGSLVRTVARFAGRHLLRRGMEAAADPRVRERVRERLASVPSEQGGGVFGRLDDGAKRVVVFARDEARNALGHDHVGTEHLVLGLLRAQGDGAGGTEAIAAFEAVGVSGSDVLRKVIEVSGESTSRPAGNLPFTRDARRSLLLAQEEADRLGHGKVRPGHLLLGVLLVDDGLGAQVLRELDVDLEHLWAVTREGLSGPDGESAESPMGDVDRREPPSAEHRLGLLEERLSVLESRLEALEHRLGPHEEGP